MEITLKETDIVTRDGVRMIKVPFTGEYDRSFYLGWHQRAYQMSTSEVSSYKDDVTVNDIIYYGCWPCEVSPTHGYLVYDFATSINSCST
jgi:hypothetical protein